MLTPSFETLREQYNIAVELYRHEDDLSWMKLNHLFYVNTGLWAIIGFILKSGTFIKSSLISVRFLVGVVSLVGLIVSVAFEIAICYGIRYMHSRKDVVTSIEQILVQNGGQYVVSSEEKVLTRSPTMWMLKSVPILLSLGWIVLFIVNLL